MKTVHIDDSIDQKVMAVLGWTELQYGEFIYECGIRYLDAYIPGYPEAKQEIIRSADFWNWWKKYWTDRDAVFLESIDTYPEGEPVELYLEQNCPLTLAAAIYLNGQILQESYAQMIEKVTKRKTQKEVSA